MNPRDLRGKYAGERLFVLGNGPSLSETPLEKLSNEYTFAVNEIHNIYNNTSWRPSFYLCLSPQDEPEAYFRTFDLGIPCFMFESRMEFFENHAGRNFNQLSNIIALEGVPLYNRLDRYEPDFNSIESISEVWSVDIMDKVYRYNGSMYPVMQIATYMGFDEIYLLGCDLYDDYRPHLIFEEGSDPTEYFPKYNSSLRNVIDFFATSDSMIKTLLNAVSYTVYYSKVYSVFQQMNGNFLGKSDNPNYYTKDYSTKPKSAVKMNTKHRNAHKLIKFASNEYGFDIYNSTLGGYLEVHERISLDHLDIPA